jgi:hypothetical protein
LSIAQLRPEERNNQNNPCFTSGIWVGFTLACHFSSLILALSGWSVEVTTRATCGFYLLPANSQFARIMVGLLGKAQEKYPVQIHAAVAASNHDHLILSPADAEELADFMAGRSRRSSTAISTPEGGRRAVHS